MTEYPIPSHRPPGWIVPLRSTSRWAFIWGYSHLFTFGAAAAAGAGSPVAVDQAAHHAEISAPPSRPNSPAPANLGRPRYLRSRL